MRLVDERGRLFGRVNLIDAFALIFVVLLVPVLIAAYFLFKVPPPALLSVEPKTLEEADVLRVRVHGANLRPYLDAYVAPAGNPLGRYLPTRAESQAKFLLESPTVAVLELPSLRTGAYDLYLYRESEALAHLENAFTVEAPRVAGPPLVPGKTVARVRIRQSLPADVAALIKAGDVDTQGSGTPGEPDASVVAVTRAPLPNQSAVNPYVLATIELRIPVSRPTEAALWTYKGQRVRVGESLMFGTPSYVTQGTIVQAEFPPDVPWDNER